MSLLINNKIMVYKLSIESNSEDILREIQQWVNTNYNCDKILWNAITIKK